MGPASAKDVVAIAACMWISGVCVGIGVPRASPRDALSTATLTVGALSTAVWTANCYLAVRKRK